MYHIIVNPASRSGQGQEIWKRIEPAFLESGVTYQLHLSKNKGDITRLCRELTGQADSGEPVRLVILGGDGSMNEAVNGIQNFENTLVGYVMSGSGNDLARDLLADISEEEQLQRILKGEVVRRIDVGEVEYHDEDASHPEAPDHAAGSVHRFNISCGIGYDAQACWIADHSSIKKLLNALHLGQLVYIFSAIRSIAVCPLTDAEVTMEPDGEADTGSGPRVYPVKRFLLGVGMNHRYQGGGYKFCPDAVNDDGMLDYCVAGDFKRLSFFRIFPGINKGLHLKEPGIFPERSHVARIRTRQPLWVHTDGEVERESADITLRALPGVLQLMH